MHVSLQHRGYALAFNPFDGRVAQLNAFLIRVNISNPLSKEESESDLITKLIINSYFYFEGGYYIDQRL